MNRAVLILAVGTLVAAIALTPVQAAVFQVNSSADTHDALPGDGVCADTSGGIGFCTLRAAVEEANALAGPDTIHIPWEVSPISLKLGAVRVTENGTLISGLDSLPVIDGLENPLAENSLEILSDSNRVTNLTFARARRHAIFVSGRFNVLGDSLSTAQMVFYNNGIDLTEGAAIAISGSDASNNIIAGNYIGMVGNGTVSRGNTNGIRLERRTSRNEIRGNLISGNVGYGVVITEGAVANTLLSNIIGPDITVVDGPGNGAGGILLENGADSNEIGLELDDGRNFICRNQGNGVTIGASDHNLIRGNFIGLDVHGRTIIGNTGVGVAITDGAAYNIVGGTDVEQRNLISGNDGDGVLIRGRGTSGNLLRGNYIGMDRDGIRMMGNGVVDGFGVTIDSGASGNVIGTPAISDINTISGNLYGGLRIVGAGSNDNVVANNFIGVNAFGTSSSPNGVGVVISGGARNNLIGGGLLSEGNVISGNRADVFPLGCGVLITDPGTEFNTISGNYIGLDVSGSAARRNATSGVIIMEGASNNSIGGTTVGERNVISGNGVGAATFGLARGVQVLGVGTDSNRIIGNYIGVSANGEVQVENIGHGVGVFAGARNNRIGGNSEAEGNLIALNTGYGVVIDGEATKRNLIRYNRMHDNALLGIALRAGAQGSILPPVISSAAVNQVTGLATVPGGRVDVYLADVDSSGHGEGVRLVGSALADELGDFIVPLAGVTEDDTVTAVLIDANDNTSEFSANAPVGFATAVDDDRGDLPLSYRLGQNYPNPFNPSTVIDFSIPRRGRIELEIFDILGRRVRLLVAGHIEAGNHSVEWDGHDDRGRPVASGVYFSRLRAIDFWATSKLVLLR
jgi:CSLREA domain-containing protein